ncbi:HIG1 domain family member 1C [Trichoplax sp. H2]|nr:HIG1 domain family member 1C [Trichoplax sp. H2]|eukprot:RDD45353.1 HIG1 domain family member 1C [Trichoplax sp. H2]
MPISDSTNSFKKPQWRPDDDVSENKLKKKFLDEPFVPLGMLGTFGAVAYGIHQYKNRPAGMNLSRYILKFRVLAQGVTVGAIMVGVCYSYLKDARK